MVHLGAFLSAGLYFGWHSYVLGGIKSGGVRIPTLQKVGVRIPGPPKITPLFFVNAVGLMHFAEFVQQLALQKCRICVVLCCVVYC